MLKDEFELLELGHQDTCLHPCLPSRHNVMWDTWTWPTRHEAGVSALQDEVMFCIANFQCIAAVLLPMLKCIEASKLHLL